MREVLARMSDEELEELAEMDHQQLDQFYNEYVEAVKRSRRHVKNDDHDHSNLKEEEHTVYVGIGDELIKLEGLSENQMEELMEPAHSAVTEEDLAVIRALVASMSTEELDILSNMSAEDVDEFYKNHVEESKKVATIIAKREASPDPEPSFDSDGIISALSDQQTLIDDYVQKIRWLLI